MAPPFDKMKATEQQVYQHDLNPRLQMARTRLDELYNAHYPGLVDRMQNLTEAEDAHDDQNSRLFEPGVPEGPEARRANTNRDALRRLFIQPSEDKLEKAYWDAHNVIFSNAVDPRDISPEGRLLAEQLLGQTGQALSPAMEKARASEITARHPAPMGAGRPRQGPEVPVGPPITRYADRARPVPGTVGLPAATDPTDQPPRR